MARCSFGAAIAVHRPLLPLPPVLSPRGLIALFPFDFAPIAGAPDAHGLPVAVQDALHTAAVLIVAEQSAGSAFIALRRSELGVVHPPPPVLFSVLSPQMDFLRAPRGDVGQHHIRTDHVAPFEPERDCHFELPIGHHGVARSEALHRHSLRDIVVVESADCGPRVDVGRHLSAEEDVESVSAVVQLEGEVIESRHRALFVRAASGQFAQNRKGLTHSVLAIARRHQIVLPRGHIVDVGVALEVVFGPVPCRPMRVPPQRSGRIPGTEHFAVNRLSVDVHSDGTRRRSGDRGDGHFDGFVFIRIPKRFAIAKGQQSPALRHHQPLGIGVRGGRVPDGGSTLFVQNHQISVAAERRFGSRRHLRCEPHDVLEGVINQKHSVGFQRGEKTLIDREQALSDQQRLARPQLVADRLDFEHSAVGHHEITDLDVGRSVPGIADIAHHLRECGVSRQRIVLEHHVAVDGHPQGVLSDIEFQMVASSGSQRVAHRLRARRRGEVPMGVVPENDVEALVMRPFVVGLGMDPYPGHSHFVLAAAVEDVPPSAVLHGVHHHVQFKVHVIGNRDGADVVVLGHCDWTNFAERDRRCRYLNDCGREQLTDVRCRESIIVHRAEHYFALEISAGPRRATAKHQAPSLAVGGRGEETVRIIAHFLEPVAV